MSQLNIANLDRLISHLEGLPEERFNMRYLWTLPNGDSGDIEDLNDCGTAACIAGWCYYLGATEAVGTFCRAQSWLGIDSKTRRRLFLPHGNEIRSRYPLSRAIRTLKHMRAEFLRTGQVVVDWDAPEPAARKDWVAPKVSEQKLPAEITKLLTTFDRVEVL